ncbi:hypothetical protein FRC02_002042 [Tulasnella sp. 418]|nr:hypothetical protein FRC02_002042 [Tulasnella sp. 418]
MVWVAGVLREAGFTNVEAVTSAAVPIVKFHDPRSGLDSDVNCNSRLGISVTTLFEKYCSLYTGLRAMIFVIKKWAGLYDLNNPSISSAGRYNVSFSSYCLVLMIISYLQIKGVLPNLQSSDRLASVPSSVFNIRDKFKGWIRCDTRIGSARGFRGEELSVGDAVYGWFRYFAHEHRYSTQYLSIRHGGLLPSGHFQRSDLKSSELTVQDPFIVSKNVSGSCRSHVIQKFRDECGRAATALKDGTSIEKLLERRTSSQYGSASTSRYIPSSSYTSAPRYTSTSSPYRSRYIPSTSSGMFRF